jgi:Bardet-Biedl syndrome 9 protein
LIEKRLLVRFKDRNPTPLHGLDLVLKEAYANILAIADDVERHQKRSFQLSAELECFAKLLAALVGMKFNMTPAERNVLQAHLCPEVKDSSEQGWEETVQASLAQLLRSTLSKSSKESAALAATKLDVPKSVDVLKETLLAVLDRIEKGGRIDITSGHAGSSKTSASGNTALSAAAQPSKASK